MAGLAKRPLVTSTMTSPWCTGCPVQVRYADGCSREAGAAVVALGDPAAAVGGGGLDVRAVVTGTADLDSVRAAAVELHVTYGVLELAVVQLVQVLDELQRQFKPPAMRSRLSNGRPAAGSGRCFRFVHEGGFHQR